MSTVKDPTAASELGLSESRVVELSLPTFVGASLSFFGCRVGMGVPMTKLLYTRTSEMTELYLIDVIIRPSLLGQEVQGKR